MARQTFAGDLAAFVATTATVSGTTDVLRLARNFSGITVWNALTGGTQYTDLQTLAGAPITTVTADSNGLFAFKGPDEIYEVWMDAGAGSRQYGSARTTAKLLTVETTANGAVAKSVATTKGDLFVATGSATVVRMPVGTDGHILTAKSSVTNGIAYGPVPRELSFSQGTLIVGVGTYRWYNDTGGTLVISRITASVGTAPTGASLIMDVNINGTTIFSTQANRPTIAVSTNKVKLTTGWSTLDITDGQYFTIDIDQIGSTVAGSNLDVQIELIP